MYSVTDLETFAAVAQQGGINAAARQHGISPATVSHRIGKLEEVLKLTLFHRNSRTLALTDEGHVFLERILPILDDLYQAEVDAGAGNSSVRGHLRVTVSPWILSRFIMPFLPAFREEFPQLTLEFLAVDRFVPLVEERQDCAIRVGQLTDSTLIAQKICDNDRLVCAAPAFIERVGMPTCPGDLRSLDWVCLPWQKKFSFATTKGGMMTLKPVSPYTVTNSESLTEGALQGLGLAVKSRLAIQEELKTGKLVELLPGALQPSDAPIWFVFPPDARLGRKTKIFGKLVKSAFRKSLSID